MSKLGRRENRVWVCLTILTDVMDDGSGVGPVKNEKRVAHKSDRVNRVAISHMRCLWLVALGIVGKLCKIFVEGTSRATLINAPRQFSFRHFGIREYTRVLAVSELNASMSLLIIKNGRERACAISVQPEILVR